MCKTEVISGVELSESELGASASLAYFKLDQFVNSERTSERG